MIRQKINSDYKSPGVTLLVFCLSLLFCLQPLMAQKSSALDMKPGSKVTPKTKLYDNKTTPQINKSGQDRIDTGPGVQDKRLSDMGGLGIANYSQALECHLAFNTSNGNYLVVWRGDDQNDGKDEIYGQLVGGDTGQEMGENDFMIAQMDGDITFDTRNPAVVYNSILDEFLVVWQGTHTSTSSGAAEEIFARRIAADGSLLQLDGSNAGLVTDFLRISQMGSEDDNINLDALEPDVAFNPTLNKYLVVWYGDSLKHGEKGIFGQLLHFDNGVLSEDGSDFQITDIATSGSGLNNSESPAVVFNSDADEWLVVWAAENGNANAFAIFGRRLSTDSTPIDLPFEIGTQPAGESREPDIAWNNIDNQYLVVWRGLNIYGQLLENDGSENGNDFIIGSPGRSVGPQVAHNPKDNDYLVVWRGDDGQNNEYEVFGQQLSNSGAEIETNDFAISEMGPPGDDRFGTQGPQVSFNQTGQKSYLVIWAGDDNKETVDDELEIFGRIVGPEADLSITKDDGLTEVFSGTQLIYTLTVMNNGPDGVLSTTVWDSLPQELINTTWTAEGSGGAGGFDLSGNGNINDKHINLPAGGGIVYTITGIVDSTLVDQSLLTNMASIIDDIIYDPVPDNNSDTDDDTKVINQADLVISKDDNVSRVAPGGTLTYKIAVKNNGRVVVTNTTVTDTFPDQLTSIAWTATGSGGASGFDPSGTGDLIDTGIMLPKDAGITYQVSAIVDPATPDSTLLNNAAHVMDSIAVDPDPTNNSDSDTNTMVLVSTGDTDPPVITVRDTLELWPPHHKYAWIWLKRHIISVADSADSSISLKDVVIDSVWSDEADSSRFAFDFDDFDSLFAELCGGNPFDDDNENQVNKDGDGDDDDDAWDDDEYDNLFPDIIIGPFCRTVLLRQERNGEGNGRVYTVHVSVEDSSGNKGTARFYVTIPHDQSGDPAIDDGPAYSVRSRCAEEPPVNDIIDQTITVIPEKTYLHQNYPNPFNPETTIRFDLVTSAIVRLRIYDVLGQEVRVITDQRYNAGSHSLIWNGRDRNGHDLASGVYIYQLQAGDVVINKKLILMR